MATNPPDDKTKPTPTPTSPQTINDWIKAHPLETAVISVLGVLALVGLSKK